MLISSRFDPEVQPLTALTLLLQWPLLSLTVTDSCWHASVVPISRVPMSIVYMDACFDNAIWCDIWQCNSTCAHMQNFKSWPQCQCHWHHWQCHRQWQHALAQPCQCQMTLLLIILILTILLVLSSTTGSTTLWSLMEGRQARAQAAQHKRSRLEGCPRCCILEI